MSKTVWYFYAVLSLQNHYGTLGKDNHIICTPRGFHAGPLALCPDPVNWNFEFLGFRGRRKSKNCAGEKSF